MARYTVIIRSADNSEIQRHLRSVGKWDEFHASNTKSDPAWIYVVRGVGGADFFVGHDDRGDGYYYLWYHLAYESGIAELSVSRAIEALKKDISRDWE